MKLYLFLLFLTAIYSYSCRSKNPTSTIIENSNIQHLRTIADSNLVTIGSDAYIKYYDTIRIGKKLSGYFIIKNMGADNNSIFGPYFTSLWH